MDSTDPVDRLNAALFGRYRIERELGAGGMATVYLADDLKHQRRVAIKVLKPELAAAIGAERFLAEIRTTANLQHPHILPLHDSGEAGGLLFYVMPHVEGESLKERLEREHQLSVEEAVSIATKIANALHTAHEQGVIHRDVKPANILMSKGEPLVADFGISLALGSDAAERLTDTGTSIGTPAYMSPEQGLEGSRLDRRSDIYSLGCVLFEMLLGDPPFTGSNPMAVLVRKSTEEPPPVSPVRGTVTRELEAVVLKALAKVPADRYTTADEFATALRSALDAPRAISGAAGGAGRGARERPGLPRPALALTAVAVLATGAWAVDRWGFGGGDSESLISTLAILPFTNFSGDPAQELFTNELHAQFISLFQRLESPAVRSRRSVMRFADEQLGISGIGRELDVDAVIDGWLERTPDSVRIELSLIRTRGEETVWRGTFAREVTGLGGLLDEVMEGLAEPLGLARGGDAMAETRGSRQTPNSEAFDAFLEGEARFRYYTREDSLRLALDYYGRATRLDGSFAIAHAKASLTHTWIWYWGWDRSSSRLASAKASADRALSLDSELPEAYWALGLYTLVTENIAPGATGRKARQRALTFYQAALDRAPNNPDLHMEIGHAMREEGEWEQSYGSFVRALRLDPDHSPKLVEAAWVQKLRGLYSSALEHLDRANTGGSRMGHLLRIETLVALDGNTDRAVESMRALILPDLVLPGWAFNGTLWLYAAAADEVLSRRLLEADRADGGGLAVFANHADYFLVKSELHDFFGDAPASRAFADSALATLDSLLSGASLEDNGKRYLGRLHQQRAVARALLSDEEGAVSDAEAAVAYEPLEDVASFGTEPLVTQARVLARVGRHDEAVEVLDLLLSVPSDIERNALRIHPWWAPLAGHPGFEALLAPN